MKRMKMIARIRPQRSVDVSGDTYFGYEGLPSNAKIIYHHPLSLPKISGRVYRCSIEIPCWELDNLVSLRIPEEKEYVYKEDIKYHSNEMPVADNEYVVPDVEIEEFSNSLKDSFSTSKGALYKSAAMLAALSEANIYVKAALRDGAGIDIEPDESLFEAFVHISRLDMISKLVDHTTMPVAVKEKYLDSLCTLLATETVTSMGSADKGSKIRAELQKFHARVRPKEEIEQSESATLGVRRSRV